MICTRDRRRVPDLSLYTYIIHDLSVLVNSTRDTFYTVTVKKYFCFFSVFTSKFVLCASWGYWHTGVGLRQYRRTTTRREPTPIFELLTNVLGGRGSILRIPGTIAKNKRATIHLYCATPPVSYRHPRYHNKQTLTEECASIVTGLCIMLCAPFALALFVSAIQPPSIESPPLTRSSAVQ